MLVNTVLNELQGPLLLEYRLPDESVTWTTTHPTDLSQSVASEVELIVQVTSSVPMSPAFEQADNGTAEKESPNHAIRRQEPSQRTNLGELVAGGSVRLNPMCQVGNL